MLGAGVLHAGWNAVTKAVEDRVGLLFFFGVALGLAGAVGVVLIGLPPGVAIAFAAVSALVHVGYDLALMRAYRLGAFNQMYPVARGTAPLVVAAGAAVIAHEHLSAPELAGVVVLAAGLLSLALSSGRIERAELPALGAAVLTGFAIASYSLLDGLGARHAHDAFSYMALLCLVEGPLLAATVLAVRRPRRLASRELALRGLLAGGCSVLAYGAVVWAQTRAPLAVVSALRETGVISAAVIGAVVFREGFGYRRVASAAVVALGIVLIGI